MTGITTQFDLVGADELIGRLEEIDFDMKRKGGRYALRRASNLIAKKAKAGAERLNRSETPENIALNVSVRWNSREWKRNRNLAFRVGILGGSRIYTRNKTNVRKGRAGQSYTTQGDKSNPGGDTWYWRFLEFGTETMQARPFLRPAIEQNKSAAIQEFITEYGKALDRAIKRARKKQV